MKFKSRKNFSIDPNNFNNTITTFNLKIKNLHILLDDISTSKTSKNSRKIKRVNSYQYNNEAIQKFSTISYNNSYNFVYSKKRLSTKNMKKEKEKSVKSIPIRFKRNESYKNTESSNSSFLTTMKNFYNSKLAGLISEKNNSNKSIFMNRIKNNDICCKIDDIIDNNKVYIRKSNEDKSRYSHRRSRNDINDIPIIYRTKVIKNEEFKRIFINKNKTLNIKPNLISIDNNSKPKIIKKKIKFDVNKNKKKLFKNNSSLNLNCVISIQKWWKRIKKKNDIDKNIIFIQKAFRTFLRKNYKNKDALKKINRDNSQIYFITKVYYKNNIQKVILIQKYFKKYLSKINFYNIIPFSVSINSLYLKKPLLKLCYLTKENNTNIASNSNIRSITFDKKKSDSFSKKKRNLKFKYLINNYNSFTYNFTTKNYDIQSKENNFHDFNNSESNDFDNNYDIINKITYQIINKNDINNNYNNKKEKNNLHDLFIRNIFRKLNLLLFQSGYTYKCLFNLINSIDCAFIKSRLSLFFENLSLFNSKKINFIKNICRHVNIYKKNNYIKNEIIELIESNLSKGIVDENFDSKIFNLDSKQENILINTQIFKDDKDLIKYIYLFFKYEKNKKISIDFIKSRLMKEPLNYRNIFTILRYIDNLDEKINANKICINCFCKKNERVCLLKCNCHFIVNIINMNNQDIKRKKIIEQFKNKTYQNNEENIENDQNILNTEHKNNKDNIKNKESRYANTELCKHNIIKEMHINKTFHYFNK